MGSAMFLLCDPNTLPIRLGFPSYRNGKYIFTIMANKKPSNKLNSILKLINKSRLRKEMLLLLINMTTVILNYRI